MRKIETLMNKALINSKNWKLANTEVTFDQESGHCRVYLHGNHIATLGETFITITDAGYQTDTTKSRLNAIIRTHCLEGEKLYQKRGEWFIKKRTVDGKDFENIPFYGTYTF